ncbi:hypothetical protein AMR42_11440 [Limnothrix sp. PR1529]|nr:hypothetical protein AMR42_11440 [Limnothrix sp. PR1529]
MVALGCRCPAKDEDQGDRGFKSGLAIFLTCLPGAGVINDAAGLRERSIRLEGAHRYAPADMPRLWVGKISDRGLGCGWLVLAALALFGVAPLTGLAQQQQRPPQALFEPTHDDANRQQGDQPAWGILGDREGQDRVELGGLGDRFLGRLNGVSLGLRIHGENLESLTTQPFSNW